MYSDVKLLTKWNREVNDLSNSHNIFPVHRNFRRIFFSDVTHLKAFDDVLLFFYLLLENT